MKHLLNNMTEEEKNAIREQHSKILVNEQPKWMKTIKNLISPELKTAGKNVAKSEVKSVTQNVGQKVLSEFEKRFLLNNCKNMQFCDIRTIYSNFMSKLGGSAKLNRFYPKDVKVISRSTISGREVIETQLPDGSKVLFYKSSGANVGTTGKEAGEWFVIPGFAEDGWFFKTKETVELTKGGNKYLTDMAEFLKLNGSNMIGK
jgi:hypothetical protein